MYKLIDKYNEFGNELIDKLLIPLFQTGKKHILDNTYLKDLQVYRNEKITYKIKIFIENINLFNNELLHEINNLTNDEKHFLTDCMDKVIDLNDYYQVAIVAYLVSEYKKREGELLFWQKSLYYSINTISESDIEIFINIIETSETKESNGKNFNILTSLNIEQQIILNKFINLGILYPDERRSLNNNFILTEHAKEFYSILKEISKLVN